MSFRGRALRLLGDFFLGLAIGLLAYEAVTGAVAWNSQRELRGQFERVAYAGPVDTGGSGQQGEPVLDFEGWRAEDVRYWRSLRDGEVFGRIVAPRAGIDAAVVKGVSRNALRLGPGWAPYTDLPGPSGNVGISGHRTTYLAPFRRLDALAAGDTIDLYSPYRRYRYRVVRSFAVTPDRTDVMDSTEEPQLTLTACHPPYSARLRLVVKARLVEVRRLRER